MSKHVEYTVAYLIDEEAQERISQLRERANRCGSSFESDEAFFKFAMNWGSKWDISGKLDSYVKLLENTKRKQKEAQELGQED